MVGHGIKLRTEKTYTTHTSSIITAIYICPPITYRCALYDYLLVHGIVLFPVPATGSRVVVVCSAGQEDIALVTESGRED